jgi:hypothetical protein
MLRRNLALSKDTKRDWNSRKVVPVPFRNTAARSAPSRCRAFCVMSGTLPLNKRFTENKEDDMFKSLDIQEHMEVVGSDGKHVGTVDHKEGGDRLMLTKDDPKAGGHHHLISIDWVDYVDRKVHLNKPSQKATVEWQIVA